MKTFWTRCLLAVLAMVIVDLIFSPTQNDYSPENLFWNVISNLMIAITMNYVAKYSFEKTSRLVLALWFISFSIGTFNILIEAWIFNVTDSASTFLAMMQGLFKFGLMSVVFSYVLPYTHSEPVHKDFVKRGIFQWTWRVGVGVLLYFVFYIAAGMILQVSLPEIMEYYSSKMPDLNVILYTQFFRGLIFVGVAIFMQRIVVQTSKSTYAILVGLVFSILGGVAPLIPPNDLMPAIIRLGHGFEVGISNFFFGLLLGLTLFRARVTF